MKNVFIALEGIDGSGKSTQAALLKELFEKAGHKIHLTCEPTDSPIGLLIRKIFKHELEADHRTIAALFVADRLDHILNQNDGILKKLEQGYTVISDRYYFSSYAYQGTHAPLDWVISANSLSAELLKPDLNVFIDISPEESMNRIKKGRETIELYESVKNLRKVRDKYYEVFERMKSTEKIFITDGNRTPETVALDIWNKITAGY